MRRRRLLVTLLAAFSMAAMLLGGLAALPPQTTSDVFALPEPDVTVLESEDETSVDEVVLVARRRKSVRFTMRAAFDFFVWVNINPNLTGNKSYKARCQYKHKGDWRLSPGMGVQRTRGKAEIMYCGAGDFRTRATRKYRVVVPAQHGFQRTVSPVFFMTNGGD